MNKTLYLVRGVPGSGKSTLARKLARFDVCEADDYFYDETGTYAFCPWELKKAHARCQRVCGAKMREEREVIAVANTFTMKWEMKPYYELADKYGYIVVEIICRGKFKNIHGVPEEKVQEMRRRFEY